MAKLSPWGIVHRIPTCIIQPPPPEYNQNSTLYTKTQHQNKMTRNSFAGLLSWFSKNNRVENNETIVSPESQLERLNANDYLAETSPTNVLPPHYNKVGESSTHFPEDQKSSWQESDEVNKLKKKTLVLTQRMEEMEFMLSEYFINTRYLDQLRYRRKLSTLEDPEVIFD